MTKDIFNVKNPTKATDDKWNSCVAVYKNGQLFLLQISYISLKPLGSNNPPCSFNRIMHILHCCTKTKKKKVTAVFSAK